jgi:hypothetical protein
MALPTIRLVLSIHAGTKSMGLGTSPLSLASQRMTFVVTRDVPSVNS